MAPFLDSGYYTSTNVAALFAGAALADYSVGGNDPDVVADFAGVNNGGTEYYRVGGSETTFSSMFTYSGASNGTMTDSSGNLVWKPHNLLTYSEQFDNAAWVKSAVTITANSITAPDGNTTADTVNLSSTSSSVRQSFTSAGASVTYTARVWLQAGTANSIVLQVSDLTTNAFGANIDLTAETATLNADIGSAVGASASIASAGGGWYLVTIVGTPGLSGTTNFNVADGPNGTGTVYMWGAHLYRSDLGGMVALTTDQRDYSASSTYLRTTTAARYLPRRNNYRYNGTSFVKKGILLESSAATNLSTHSNDGSGTNWTITAGTNTPNDSVSPTGQTDANSFIPNTSNTGHWIAELLTCGASGNHTSSFYVKADGYNWVQLAASSNYTGAPSSGPWQNFNLSDGSKGNSGGSGGVALDIEAVGNGWYRIFLTAPVVAGTTATRALLIVLNGDSATRLPSFAGNGTSGILWYGHQFEASSTPTSYIPTSGATATRAAETLTIAGSDMAYSATAMSFHMQGEANYADGNSAGQFSFFGWEGSSSTNKIQMFMDSDRGTGGINYFLQASNINRVESGGSDFAPGVNVSYNLAMRVVDNGGDTTVNGASGGTAETASTGLPNSMPAGPLSSYPFRFGDATTAGVTAGLYSNIALFRQWDADIGNSGIATASA